MSHEWGNYPENFTPKIAHANENDVIEFDATIYTPTGSVLGRDDCPITIRRATSNARFILGDSRGENIQANRVPKWGLPHRVCFRSAPFP